MDILTILLWITIAILSALLMENKGRNPLIGLLIGGVLGVIGLIVCLLWPKAETKPEEVKEIK